jgi:hypothetical protein
MRALTTTAHQGLRGCKLVRLGWLDRPLAEIRRMKSAAPGELMHVISRNSARFLSSAGGSCSVGPGTHHDPQGDKSPGRYSTRSDPLRDTISCAPPAMLAPSWCAPRFCLTTAYRARPTSGNGPAPASWSIY